MPAHAVRPPNSTRVRPNRSSSAVPEKPAAGLGQREGRVAGGGQARARAEVLPQVQRAPVADGPLVVRGAQRDQAEQPDGAPSLQRPAPRRPRTPAGPVSPVTTAAVAGAVTAWRRMPARVSSACPAAALQPASATSSRCRGGQVRASRPPKAARPGRRSSTRRGSPASPGAAARHDVDRHAVHRHVEAAVGGAEGGQQQPERERRPGQGGKRHGQARAPRRTAPSPAGCRTSGTAPRPAAWWPRRRPTGRAAPSRGPPMTPPVCSLTAGTRTAQLANMNPCAANTAHSAIRSRPRSPGRRGPESGALDLAHQRHEVRLCTLDA